MSPILIPLGAAVAALMISLLISLACAGMKPSRMAPAKGTMTLIAVMTAIEAGTELTGTGTEARRIFGLGGTSPFSLVTYPYLHFGAEHLAMNMAGLAVAGTVCERQWGTRKMGVFIAAATAALGIAALWSGVVDRHWDLERFGPVAGNSVAVCVMLPAFAAITVRALTRPVFRGTRGATGNVLLLAAAAALIVAFFCVNPGRLEIDGTSFEIAGIAHAAAAVLGAAPVLMTLGRRNRPEKA